MREEREDGAGGGAGRKYDVTCAHGGCREIAYQISCTTLPARDRVSANAWNRGGGAQENSEALPEAREGAGGGEVAEDRSTSSGMGDTCSSASVMAMSAQL